MAEYMDRDAVISEIERREALMVGDKRISVDAMKSFIKNRPAADVAPVVHGRWIDKGEYAVCMECGGRSGTQYDGVEPIPLMTQFCPNCGAKMDGGDNTER